MNRSIFQASPFRPAYGIQPIVMGQFEDVTEAVEPLLAELDDLIRKLPVDVAGNYAKRRDECMAKSVFSRYKCLYDLFQEAKAAYRDGGKPVPPTQPTQPTQPTTPSGGIPIWAFAVGGVALAGILYAAFGK